MPAANATLQLGLLSIPAKLHKATVDRESNKTLCVGQPGHGDHAPTPIKQPYTCEHCGVVIDSSALKKGVLTDDGYAIVEVDDLNDARDKFTSEFKGVINLVAHPAGDVLNNTAPGDTLNFIQPANAKDCVEGCKGCSTCRYALMVRLVEQHPEIVFTALYTPRSATNIYILQVRDGVLLLQKRVRSDDLRDAPPIPQPAEFKEKLYAQLEAFLDVEPFNAEDYEDKYAKAVAELAAKAEDTITVESSGTTKKAAVTISDDDLLAKLVLLKAAS